MLSEKTYVQRREVGMEFASLQDAFPHMDNESPRKEKRKGKAASKENFQAYEMPPTDADRPAMKRLTEVPAMSRDTQVPDEYMDESSKFQKRMTVHNSLPSPKTLNKQPASANVPSFFGAEPFTNPGEDTHALYSHHVNSPSAYMLEADFTKSFDQTGFNRSTGVIMPVPELRNRWKPLSGNRVSTAYTGSSNGEKDGQFAGLDMSDVNAMRAKLDALIARLDDLENRSESTSPQLEMLSFIMTGLFLMFILDVSVRKSTGMRLMNVR